MIEKIKIFGHTLLKFQVPLDLYESQSLKNDIENVFNTDLILSKGVFSREQRGICYSTCFTNDNTIITNLSDISPIINYISEVILTEFYNNPTKKIFYERMWINKMFKNCSGICHRHLNPNIDGVVVFYFNAPKNSGNLIVLKNYIEGEVKEEHKNISHYIKIKTGDVIIHEKNVLHAVSKHLNDDPRICFIFEFGEKLKKKKQKKMRFCR